MMENRDSSIKGMLPSVIIGIICFAIVIGVLIIPVKKKSPIKKDLSEYSSINAICELATLKSFYHNVAVYEEGPDTGASIVNTLLWPFYTKAGYKQFWVEYTGIVESGVDAGQIRISSPNAEGVVEVFLPEAKVLNIDADDKSLSNPITEEGMFAEISGEDQVKAYSAAQSSMRQEAENDTSMLTRARNNAKLLLERYIIDTGKMMGVDYSVRWIDTPDG